MDILLDFVPQVKGRIEYHHLGTPLSECTFLASYRGGSYGTQCVPEMFVSLQLSFWKVGKSNPWTKLDFQHRHQTTEIGLLPRTRKFQVSIWLDLTRFFLL